MAEATSARAARARKMFPASSLWAKPRNWRERRLPAAISIDMSALRDRLEQTILDEVEATGVNGQGAPRVPNTTSIYFDCIEGEALVIALDLKGLAVSTGAACSSGAIEPSHVLTAMGMRPEQARGSLRFSLGKQNTSEDVEFALSLIPQTVAQTARAVAGLQ